MATAVLAPVEVSIVLFGVRIVDMTVILLLMHLLLRSTAARVRQGIDQHAMVHDSRLFRYRGLDRSNRLMTCAGRGTIQ